MKVFRDFFEEKSKKSFWFHSFGPYFEDYFLLIAHNVYLYRSSFVDVSVDWLAEIGCPAHAISEPFSYFDKILFLFLMGCS